MTPIERAANAVLYDLGKQMRESGETDFIEVAKVDAASLVRTMLQVIREPFQSFDDPVAIAGGEVLGAGKDRPLHWSNYAEAKLVWQAMIDAALSEGAQ
ncbi:hypothetical protein SKP52_02670 [Sphingopyxis fribergensis]|uniref:Uncharacterized protein n=1 Tax=Sphingopyxis fribergensis TaxID=1515612 RepID=A0A0A7PBT9_9SPHN|nr:hypothetical protein [Sphingopyxis fribergensis]AJA07465.1 hypothetical protein SKP52_02670 [Sphingopyxis fribergensis]